MLGSFLSCDNDEPRGEMLGPDCGSGRVDVLTARARRFHGLEPDLPFSEPGGFLEPVKLGQADVPVPPLVPRPVGAGPDPLHRSRGNRSLEPRADQN